MKTRGNVMEKKSVISALVVSAMIGCANPTEVRHVADRYEPEKDFCKAQLEPIPDDIDVCDTTKRVTEHVIELRMAE